MTSKQEAFIRHYLRTRDARTSALQAGYSRRRRLDKTIHELMNNVKVRAAIEHLTATDAESAHIDQAYIWSKLEYLVESNLERRPQIALKALELGGKRLKMWVDRVEVDQFSGHAERINRFLNELEELEKKTYSNTETEAEEMGRERSLENGSSANSADNTAGAPRNRIN